MLVQPIVELMMKVTLKQELELEVARTNWDVR